LKVAVLFEETADINTFFIYNREREMEWVEKIGKKGEKGCREGCSVKIPPILYDFHP